MIRVSYEYYADLTPLLPLVYGWPQISMVDEHHYQGDEAIMCRIELYLPGCWDSLLNGKGSLFFNSPG